MSSLPLTASGVSAELVKTTFFPYISEIENPSYFLTADLDNTSPPLNASLSVHADTSEEIKMTLPVYGRFCDVDGSDICLTVNREKIRPPYPYSTDTFGFPSTFSHEEVLIIKLSSELHDLTTPCYYYSFSTENEGSVTFTLPKNVMIFTSLTSYSYYSQNRQYIAINVCASDAPTSLYLSNTNMPFPTWAIVVLSICGTGLIMCIALMIYFSVSKRYN